MLTRGPHVSHNVCCQMMKVPCEALLLQEHWFKKSTVDPLNNERRKVFWGIANTCLYKFTFQIVFYILYYFTLQLCRPVIRSYSRAAENQNWAFTRHGCIELGKTLLLSSCSTISNSVVLHCSYKPNWFNCHSWTHSEDAQCVLLLMVSIFKFLYSLVWKKMYRWCCSHWVS